MVYIYTVYTCLIILEFTGSRHSGYAPVESWHKTISIYHGSDEQVVARKLES